MTFRIRCSYLELEGQVHIKKTLILYLPFGPHFIFRHIPSTKGLFLTWNLPSLIMPRSAPPTHPRPSLQRALYNLAPGSLLLASPAPSPAHHSCQSGLPPWTRQTGSLLRGLSLPPGGISHTAA